MRTAVRSIIILLLTAISVTACSSAPTAAPKRDPYNDADSQRSRAGQSQGEMSRDTSK